MVVISIISILAAVLIVSQNNFNKNTLLTDTAYTVALSVRESESLGLSSKGVAINVSNVGYGVHFGDSASSYLQFADTYPAIGVQHQLCIHAATDANTPAARPGDCNYTSGSDQLIQQFNFTKNFTISKLCWIVPTYNSGAWNCFTPGTGQSLDVVYERPNTQAMMSHNNGGVISNAVTQEDIEITSPQGGLRCIYLNNYGEITVSQSCP